MDSDSCRSSRTITSLFSTLCSLMIDETMTAAGCFDSSLLYESTLCSMKSNLFFVVKRARILAFMIFMLQPILCLNLRQSSVDNREAKMAVTTASMGVRQVIVRNSCSTSVHLAILICAGRQETFLL